MFIAATLVLVVTVGRETYHPRLKRKRAQELGHPLPPAPSLMKKMMMFMKVTVSRPLHMLVTEPIVICVSIYVAIVFATQFLFLAAVPVIFQEVYSFSLEQSSLVFLSLVVGCVLAMVTVILCNSILYKKHVLVHAPQPVPPEHRLYPAMIGCVGPVLGMFWFGWTAKSGISWASPVIAMIPFAWGDVCIFVSLMQYTTDCYAGTTTASVASANTFARYVFSGAFPLFTRQMYLGLGVGWASSVIGFAAAVMAVVPFAFFKYGKRIRAMSKYETANW
jgi:hypothetical protein